MEITAATQPPGQLDQEVPVFRDLVIDEVTELELVIFEVAQHAGRKHANPIVLVLQRKHRDKLARTAGRDKPDAIRIRKTGLEIGLVPVRLMEEPDARRKAAEECLPFG